VPSTNSLFPRFVEIFLKKRTLPSKKMDKDENKIKDLFATFGFRKSEQEILLFLLEARSPWPVTAIAQEIEMPRQTVNSILRDLSKKGAIDTTTRNRVKYFRLDAAHFSKYVKSQCEKFEEAKRIISKEFA
jgi:predicted transcriptional regulator